MSFVALESDLSRGLHIGGNKNCGVSGSRPENLLTSEHIRIIAVAYRLDHSLDISVT